MRCCREVQIMKSGVLVQVWCRQLLGSWIQLSGANLFCWFPENFRRPYLLVICFFKVQSKSHFSTLTSWLISGLLFPSAGQFLVSHPLSQIDTPKAGVIEIKFKKRFKKKINEVIHTVTLQCWWEDQLTQQFSNTCKTLHLTLKLNMYPPLDPGIH